MMVMADVNVDDNEQLRMTMICLSDEKDKYSPIQRKRRQRSGIGRLKN
jgi:hypothetical protein